MLAISARRDHHLNVRPEHGKAEQRTGPRPTTADQTVLTASNGMTAKLPSSARTGNA